MAFFKKNCDCDCKDLDGPCDDCEGGCPEILFIDITGCEGYCNQFGSPEDPEDPNSPIWEYYCNFIDFSVLNGSYQVELEGGETTCNYSQYILDCTPERLAIDMDEEYASCPCDDEDAMIFDEHCTNKSLNDIKLNLNTNEVELFLLFSPPRFGEDYKGFVNTGQLNVVGTHNSKCKFVVTTSPPP